MQEKVSGQSHDLLEQSFAQCEACLAELVTYAE
jgi:hypothetical protein